MKTKNLSRFNMFASLFTLAAMTAILAFPVAGRSQDPGYYDSQQGDPPSVVGRLSVLQGNVSLQSAGVQDFSAAELNYPLTTGDRLYTDNGARGEVQAGQLSVRLGAQTDFTVTQLSDSLAQFGLAQGSVHLHSFSFDPNSAVELDTPNASVSLMSQGDVRVDVYPQDNVTVVTVLLGQAHVDADGVSQTLQQGQSFQISGMNPSRAQSVGRQRPDDLDRFSSQRDALYQQAYSSEGSYVNPATIGADDLAGYGDWDNSADYGAVWYPRNVAADWAPYSDGHWANISPWGWTWVGAEPWGFAPYHYGRWARFGNRWGWVPGPQVVRPVYSPALVVFVGGPTFSRGGFSITLGGGGVAAWFPLGPREAYHPWYRSSDRYINRVNVTNIYNRNTVEVRNVYNNRTNVYANAPSSYANRSVATVAVSQRDFGSGRPVRGNAVRVDQRQFQNAPVLNRPPVEAQQQQDRGSRPPARALPPRQERPVLETRGNGNPNAPRGPRDGYNNGARGNDGRFNNGQPTPNGNNNGGRGNDGRYNNGQPVPPNQQPTPNNPNGNNNGGRNNDGRGNDGRNNNDGRFNNGRGQQPGQPPVQQPTTTGTPAQTPPAANGGRGNDGRFNNGQPAQQQPGQPTPGQPQTPSATHTPPTRDQMPDDRNGNRDRFNNGRNPNQPTDPQTQQQDQQRQQQNQQRPQQQDQQRQQQQQDQLRQQQLQQQEQQRQQQLQQQQTQQQNQQRQQQQDQQRQQQQQLEQQRQQQLQQQQVQQQNQQRQQDQQRQQQLQQQQLEQQHQQQLQQQQVQQQNQQRQQQLEQQRQQQLQQQQTQQLQQQEQQRQQQRQQMEQQRQQREAQQPTAQQPAQQQPRPQQQAAPERRQPPPPRPVTPPDDKKKE